MAASVKGADASAASETPEQLRIDPLIAASAFWIKTRPAQSIGTGSHPDQEFSADPATLLSAADKLGDEAVPRQAGYRPEVMASSQSGKRDADVWIET